MQRSQVTTTPYWINQTSPLFFLQHQPENGPINKTAVIILNSGFLHNVGPYRLSVDIANRLSSSGFVVARVDQSGKGDSPPRHDAVGIDAKLADFDETFEHLRANFAVTDCILIGLCSGADDGLDIAELRKSVSGLVLLDGFSPVTFWYYANHYYTRLRYFHSWLGWKRKNSKQKRQNLNLKKNGIKSTTTNSGANPGMSLRRWQSESKIKMMYESVLERGVKVMAIFSGSTGDYYNHQGQLSKGLKLSSSAILNEVYFSEANHIYAHPEHRSQLVRSIGNWIQSEFSQNDDKIITKDA